MRSAAVLAMILALIPALPACTNSAPAGKGDSIAEFNKVTGELSTNTNCALPECFAAAKMAMDDMGYSTERANQDALQGLIVAREANNGRLDISLERKAERVTEIEVGTGPFGNESKARMILDKILSRLGH